MDIRDSGSGYKNSKSGTRRVKRQTFLAVFISQDLSADRQALAFARPGAAQTKLNRMFGFEKLTVYQKSKDYSKAITAFIESKQFNKVTDNQLRRASFSLMLNIA